MSKIHNFESFNEELNQKTYLSASDKLKSKGHPSRADALKRYAFEQPLKMAKEMIQPVTVDLYGDTYTIDSDNIIVEENNDMIIVEVCFDLDTRFDEEKSVIYYLNFTRSKVLRSYNFEYDGIMLTRKAANKVLSLLKKYADIVGGVVGTEIKKLSVNDLYEE